MSAESAIGNDIQCRDITENSLGPKSVIIRSSRTIHLCHLDLKVKYGVEKFRLFPEKTGAGTNLTETHGRWRSRHATQWADEPDRTSCQPDAGRRSSGGRGSVLPGCLVSGDHEARLDTSGLTVRTGLDFSLCLNGRGRLAGMA